MFGIKVTRKGDILTLEVKLVDGRASGSGKNVLAASSEGNQVVDGPGGWKFGLNVFHKPGAK